jgi:UDP-N-acetylmuramoyl-tripeptide--D-alanyl-D-alanine ligase
VALGDLAREYRRTLASARVIAITGSAGKTTTKHLLHAILRRKLTGTAAIKSFNNDIGVPLTILSANPHDQYLLLEAGTNGPGEIASLASIIQPDIGIITSIGRSHLEGLESVQGVAREKVVLLSALPREGLAIMPAPCAALDGLLGDVRARIVRVGTARDAEMQFTGRGRQGSGWWFEVGGDQRFWLQLPGRHSALNAMMAIAAARAMGLCDDEIRPALEAATPPEMRMTRCTVNGIDFFNDAYNANPDSMMASLEAFAEASADALRRVVILGDMLELGHDSSSLHEEVGRFLAENRNRLGIAAVALVGRSAMHYVQGMNGAFTGGEVIEVEDLTKRGGLQALHAFLAPGDAVLLKGSRRLALERIIDGMRGQAACGRRPVTSSIS